MGETQPCPRESEEQGRHRGWDKELRAEHGAATQVGGSQGRRTSQVGSGQAGFPEAPGPTPLPPGSGISGVRAEGQLHPLLPSGSGIPWGGGGCCCFGLSPSWLPLDREPQLLLAPPPPPKPLGWPPTPFPPPAWHGVCQPLAENKPAGVGLQGAG